jgi:hypothetical protein
MGSTRLEDLASVIRSKNAGPYSLTFDILFDDLEVYLRVVASGAISVPSMALLLKQDPATVRVFEHKAARAIKVTIPRTSPAGSVEDNDIYGTQQHVPLYGVLIGF